jgi:integrase
MARNGKSLVTLRGGIYYENFTVKGHRFRGSLHTDDKDTAEIIATKTKSDALLGKLTGKKPEITLDAALGDYWLDHAHNLPSAENIEDRGVILRKGLGAKILLSEITAGILITYAGQRRSGKITHSPNSPWHGVRLKNATVNNDFITLRAVINHAKRKGYATPEIQWSDVLLEEEGERQHILSRGDEQERLFENLRDDFQAVARFALITGLRLRNLIGLKWNQVKWPEGHIVVRIKSKKPGGELLYIPITKPVAEILSGELGRHPVFLFTYVCRGNYYNSRANIRLMKGERYPIRKSNLWGEFQKAIRGAGLWYSKGSPDNFRIHDLRHTAATRALGKCRNLKTVQKMLGHKKIETTGRYAKTYTEDIADAMPD